MLRNLLEVEELSGIWDVFIYKTGFQICLQNKGRIVLIMIEAVLLLRFFISILLFLDLCLTFMV